MTAESSPPDMEPRRIALFAGLGSLALIVGALGFQYLGGIKPCEMCHWQRWPHIAAALLGIVAVPLLPRQARTLAIGVIALIAISGLIGAYQTGMQWHLLPGPAACSGHRFILGSNMVPDVQCDVVSWSLFGLSLATYNAIFSFLLAGAAGFLLLRNSR